MTTETNGIPDRQPSLPEAVARHVERLRGRIEAVEPLGGLSGSRVLRVRATDGSVVVKGGARAAEVEFYENIAPLLVNRGVGVPDLLWAGVVVPANGERWLVIEAIPTPLPRERWGPDPEVLATLGRIHRAGDEPLPTLSAPDAFRPAWPAATSQLALATLTALPPDEVAALDTILTGLRAATAPLFAPECPLSGDPNPANWGLRTGGTLVLFDWERFCLGTPALDLAPIVPGLGIADDFAAAAERYLAATADPAARRSSNTIARLAQEIALAKVWTAVELLAGIGQGLVPDGPTADWLRTQFPGWVRTIALQR